MRFFDPDPLFVKVATGVVVQAILTVAALALGYALALREQGASTLIAGFLLASTLLSGAALTGIIAAARRSSVKDEKIRALESVLAEVVQEAAKERAEAAATERMQPPPREASAADALGSAERDRGTTEERQAVLNRQL